MSQIDNARAWLGGAFHCEFRKYIETVLAGDFACALVELFERKDRLVEQQAARIAELEASKAAADDMFRSLGGEIYELNAKLAALKAQQPSAGVACALMSALEGIVHDQRVPNEVSQECAAVLIEARRLNPCRAQAVPDGEELKVLRAFYQCCASITDQLADSPKSALARLVEAVKDAAPSTQQKEGFVDEK